LSEGVVLAPGAWSREYDSLTHLTLRLAARKGHPPSEGLHLCACDA